jgi:subtilisin family serine protease
MRKVALATAVGLVLMAAPQGALAAEGDDALVPISIVVRMTDGNFDAVLDVATEENATVESLIPSRGVYLLTDDELVKAKDAEKEAEKFAKDVGKEDAVMWADVEWHSVTGDDRFYAWPHDDPSVAAALDLENQAAAAELELSAVHAIATGAGMTVAVLDTGVDPDHPFYAGLLVDGWDMIDDDGDPWEQTDGADDDGDGLVDEAFGHGTFVAGVVAQVAPGAQIMPVRVLDADGRGELHRVIEGIYYAIESGADVINMSFGLLAKNESDALDDVLKYAKDEGVLVVASAGNTGDDDKRYPASDKYVISVAAADEGGQLIAPFSSRGDWVDVAAPGVQIVSSVPDDSYAMWGGSSMAAPIVAGQVALLRELYPDEKVKDIEKAIFDTAEDMEDKKGAKNGMINILASVS